MDPAITEILQRTENIEMAMKEIDTNRPFVLAAFLGLVVPFLTFVWAGFRWPFQELWTALKEEQAAKNEIHQKLLRIPVEIGAEIKARSESIDDILKEVRATQAAVSAIELVYESDRLINERRYEFAVTTLTQLIEALHISLHNHKLLLKSEYNEFSNLVNRGAMEFPVLSAEEFDSLDAICEAQQPIITSMMARTPIIFGSNILEIVDKYQNDIDRIGSKPKEALGDRLNIYEKIVSIEEEAYTSLVKEARTVLFRLPDNNSPSH